MIKKSSDIQAFVKKSGYQKIMDCLIDVINKVDPDLDATIQQDKIVITKNENWEHWISSIAGDSDHVNLFLQKGKLLKDHHKKLIGKGTVMKRLEIHHIDEINEECICDYLKQAIEKQFEVPMLYTNHEY